MTYYPIMIPTLNRYVHFKRCVESLAKNTHADKTELVIGLDYPPSEKYVEGFNKIKNYIPTITGFKKVTIFERLENYGPDKNWEELQKYVFNHYDAVICSEDDNEFSPCFLDYMNKALDYYWDNEKVVSVSGFINKSYYDKISSPLLFTYDNNAWGIGLWKHKERLIKRDKFDKVIKSSMDSWRIFSVSPGIFNMLVSMVNGRNLWGDVCRSSMNILNDTYQLRPSFSLVRNTGFDGSGIHSVNDTDDLARQIISDALSFDHDVNEVVGMSDHEVRKRLFFHLLPKGLFRKVRFVIRIMLQYIKLRKSL